jgi:copper chaperone CopZ
MQTIDLNTGGMHCGSCSMLIEMTVDDLPGVSLAKADYASGRTHVEFDPTEVSADEIIAAIVEFGYTAELVA